MRGVIASHTTPYKSLNSFRGAPQPQRGYPRLTVGRRIPRRGSRAACLFPRSMRGSGRSVRQFSAGQHRSRTRSYSPPMRRAGRTGLGSRRGCRAEIFCQPSADRCHRLWQQVCLWRYPSQRSLSNRCRGVVEPVDAARTLQDERILEQRDPVAC